MTIRVTVAGAGVVGLTCAVRLAEAGFTVDVLARELPLETSSAAGGGLWQARTATPAPGSDDVRWARATLRELRALARDAGEESGVALTAGHLLGPDTAAALRDLSDDAGLVPESAPAPGAATGHRAVLPLVDLDRYLPYLTRRLTAAGGTLTRLALATLPARGVVVNCTGVAARAMTPDAAVTPIRAQVLRLANPGLTEWWHDTRPGLACWLAPHGDRVVVGGPAEPGEWSPTPEPATAATLHDRAAALVPALRDAAVLGHRVGLYPARANVRVAAERRGTGEEPATVVHCYGHGPAGLSLSWGTADDVLATVRAATEQSAHAPA
jgi:D-amino-acid oxidase